MGTSLNLLLCRGGHLLLVLLLKHGGLPMQLSRFVDQLPDNCIFNPKTAAGFGIPQTPVVFDKASASHRIQQARALRALRRFG